MLLTHLAGLQQLSELVLVHLAGIQGLNRL